MKHTKFRRSMRPSDWLNGAAILAMGVFIGLALHYLFQLSGMAFWIAAIGTPLLFGSVLLLDSVTSGLIDRIFPSGINPPRNKHPKERKPFALLLSLPAGITIGIIGAQFGLAEVLLS